MGDTMLMDDGTFGFILLVAWNIGMCLLGGGQFLVNPFWYVGYVLELVPMVWILKQAYEGSSDSL